MVTIYNVRSANGVDFAARAWTDKKRILILWSEAKPVPLSVDELIVLHETHANKSRKMIWNKETGTFNCPHCQASINFSVDDFEKLLGGFSLDKFGTYTLSGSIAEITHLVPEFPAGLPRPGYYAVAEEISE